MSHTYLLPSWKAKPAAQLQDHPESISLRKPQSLNKWRSHTIDNTVHYCSTGGGSMNTAHFDSTWELSEKDRRTVTFEPLHCPSDEGAQTPSCAKTSSTSRKPESNLWAYIDSRQPQVTHNWKGITGISLGQEETVYRLGQFAKWEALKDKCPQFRGLFGILLFLSETKLSILPLRGVHNRAQRTVASLLDPGAGPTLISSLSSHKACRAISDLSRLIC